MTMTTGLMMLLLLIAGSLFAGPTASRVWTAKNGKTAEGRVLALEEGKAVLERKDGGTVRVDLTAMAEADRKFLEKHFGIKAPAPGKPRGSGVGQASGLSYELGKVTGPIDAGGGASYHVYLPKSLKEGRRAPLLFYTHSGGGKKPTLITELTEGAELCGWIMAISVESSNGAGFPANLKVSKASVAHLIETLPVDPARVYFTGNSGGGATAMMNAAEIKSAGAMPNVGYIPSGFEPAKGDYYVLGGGKDYNRYHSAYINAKFGKSAVHRMHPGGHGVCPNWQRIDGMIWLNLRYLESQRRKHEDEAVDFEAALITWMGKISKKESHRAYSTARLLKDDYGIKDANEPLVDGLLEKLGENPKNELYHEGLAVLDEISEDVLAGYQSGGSMFGHITPEIKRSAEKHLEKFAGVPVIEGTLQAIASPSVGK